MICLGSGRIGDPLGGFFGDGDPQVQLVAPVTVDDLEPELRQLVEQGDVVVGLGGYGFELFEFALSLVELLGQIREALVDSLAEGSFGVVVDAVERPLELVELPVLPGA